MRSNQPSLAVVVVAVLAAASLSAGCAPREERARPAAGAPRVEDPGDLRPEAVTILAALESGREPELASRQSFVFTGPPPTIRVWRRSLGGSDSCTGQVDVLPLEDYVKGVLPHEWITSWEAASLEAGALAIRSYASSWIAQGGKYKCADLCDTTYSQVYKDSTHPKTNLAIDQTKSQVLLKNGALVFAEYSAENGDPTKDGVSDPVCAGKTLNGHGRGMCQWGSQRWALQAKDSLWIALHYYPGASLWTPTPSPDSGSPAAPEAGGPPVPAPDAAGSAPDAGLPSPDRGVLAPEPDAASEPPPESGADGEGLSGGCAVAPASTGDLALALLFLVALGRLRRRVRTGSCSDDAA